MGEFCTCMVEIRNLYERNSALILHSALAWEDLELVFGDSALIWGRFCTCIARFCTCIGRFCTCYGLVQKLFLFRFCTIMHYSRSNYLLLATKERILAHKNWGRLHYSSLTYTWNPVYVPLSKSESNGANRSCRDFGDRTVNLSPILSYLKFSFENYLGQERDVNLFIYVFVLNFHDKNEIKIGEIFGWDDFIYCLKVFLQYCKD